MWIIFDELLVLNEAGHNANGESRKRTVRSLGGQSEEWQATNV